MTTDDLDETTLSTLSLLESRLLRVEHLLHGQSGSQPVLQNEQTTLKLGDLERHFNGLLSKVRVYADLLKICGFESSSTPGIKADTSRQNPS